MENTVCRQSINNGHLSMDYKLDRNIFTANHYFPIHSLFPIFNNNYNLKIESNYLLVFFYSKRIVNSKQKITHQYYRNYVLYLITSRKKIKN